MSNEMTRVTLNLTPSDIENVAKLTDLPSIRNRTHAVSTALAFTAYVAEVLQSNGSGLFFRDADNELRRIVVPGLEPASSREAAFG